MSIESLLNPDRERDFMNEESVQEIEKGIFEAVMRSREAQECSTINGGDDDVVDDAPLEARPTRRDALQAASTMQKYFQDIDDPFARKLESILASFGRQTRLDEMQSATLTLITDFFTRK
ncbi:hypothetical protein K435DRAFT_699370 [Dendrothele bispora CBS 962.96]|uniref:Uncharacterized protein n=1 Tax=Dendrothele bispora (strain CBS 962.96) TaxID=1314807 RepID=A0A4S8KSL4_DENBC|nr:hypothetical protein K435DRAFT_699370 [Dendrothele bispora CBS 962.96]